MRQPRNEFLRRWREEQLGLPLGFAARAAKLEERRLVAIEGGAEPSIDEIESLARTLGLSAELLFDDGVPERETGVAPIRLLLKSAEAFSPSPDVKLRMAEAARAALDLVDLRVELQGETERPVIAAVHRQRSTGQALFRQGNALADATRRQLALQQPLASVRDLVVAVLGLEPLAADLGQDGPDAFTVYAPGRRAAIVLNLAGKNANPLVRRFSLLHELCHVLFDRPGSGPLGVACWQDAARKLDQEIRANAFAIRLLIPEAAVTREVLRSSTGLRSLITRYGVHLQALRLFAKNVLRLTAAELDSLPQVDPTAPSWVRDAEELMAERLRVDGVPLPRRGELALTALRAQVRGRIGRGRVRELLHLPASAPLEELLARFSLAPPQG